MYHILSLYDTLWHPNCIFWNGSACHVCQSFVTLSGDDNIRLRTPSTLFQNADKGIFRADKVLKLSCEGSMALCGCAQTMSNTDLSNASILVNFASRRLSCVPVLAGLGDPRASLVKYSNLDDMFTRFFGGFKTHCFMMSSTRALHWVESWVLAFVVTTCLLNVYCTCTLCII